MTALETVLDRLDRVKQSGSSWVACCPAHEDRSPSLSISERAEGDPGVVVNCHAGCTVEQITAAIGLTVADLFDDKPAATAPRITATYDYRDETGTLLYQVVRRDPKDFRQRRPDGRGGWDWTIKGTRRVLYRLPELIAADPDAPVYITEGEKDADAVASAAPATCNSGGAGKWSTVAELAAKVLAGRDVIVIPDRDTAGDAHARDVVRSLVDVARTITVAAPKVGKDAADHLAAGHTLADLEVIATTDPEDFSDTIEEWIAAEPTPEPTEPEADDQGNEDDDDPVAAIIRQFLTIDQLAALPPPQPLIEGVFDLDNVSITYGRRGSYKSFTLLDMALCVAAGIPWHGHDVTPGTVVYVVAEGSPGVYQRIEAWRSQWPGKDPTGRLIILPVAVNLLNDTIVNAFALACKAVNASFVILDTLARCIPGGDENSAKDMGIAIASMDRIRRTTGAHVDAVHHAGKDTKAGARGSSALEAAADTVLEVTKKDTDVTITQTKQKNRPEGPPLRFVARPVRSSVVLDAADNAHVTVTPKPRQALRVLDEIAGGIGETFTAWVEAADEQDIARTTVRRIRTQALEMGWIANGPNGTDKTPRYMLTDAGRAIAFDEPETAHDQG